MDVIIGTADADPDISAYLASMVVRTIALNGGAVNARLDGLSSDEAWGTEHATWIAASFETTEAYERSRETILDVAGSYGQDAVAFTVGTTEIASTPRKVIAPA